MAQVNVLYSASTVYPNMGPFDLAIFGGAGGGHGPWARVGGLPPGVLAPQQQEYHCFLFFLIVDIETNF